MSVQLACRTAVIFPCKSKAKVLDLNSETLIAVVSKKSDLTLGGTFIQGNRGNEK